MPPPDTAGRLVYDAGFTSDLLPVGGPRGSIGRDRAVSIARHVPTSLAGMPPPDGVALRRVTLGFAGQGPLTKAAWVVTWNVTSLPRGPGPVGLIRCQDILVVDALTGSLGPFEWQICGQLSDQSRNASPADV
jgi:hypothetical protein